MTDDVRVGVVGVGSMGRNHVRVYSELPGVDLVGVSDADTEAAAEVADQYQIESLDLDDLFDRVDCASVAVPTQFHSQIARQGIDAGIDLLVEKPFVDDLDEGRELAALADERDVLLQVGHIERFNPAVTALFDIIDTVDPISIEAERLGPPIERDIQDGVVKDLMIHDIDILLNLVDSEIESLSAQGAADGQYATAQIRFENDTLGSLTASRVTQRKVRKLTVTASDRLIELDYLNQTIHIYRQSKPEFTGGTGDVYYRHQNVIEQPMINSAEPLREELEAFVDASQNDLPPKVSALDAIEALEVTNRIDELARTRNQTTTNTT
ncbi:Gfo/Idh/MocA family protein [Halomarina litorea]|uniref:Gfo/Idh/MocA family protein n=1 Tax=Halomarina litorea TaxID=2961595 RepID=UPI0020C512D0|nr:Gfo/Idh/MocA family oxidoreductase [Halomarina sp. BCD28]